jgi:uncharacterized protein
MPNKRVDRLTIAECRELLDSHHFGRLGFMDYVGVFPSIIPVNYLLNEGKIVIRTDAGSKLSAAIRGAPVAFEVDGRRRRNLPSRLDRRPPWPRRRSNRLRPARRIAPNTAAGLAPTPKPHYVQINASQVSGRRIRIADVPSNWWG